MRIGLVCYAYPPQRGTGGVGTYMFRLAGALGRAGHQVHVISGPSDRPNVEQNNVTIHRVAARFDLKTRNKAISWVYWNTLARLAGWAHPSIWHLIRWDLASETAIREVDRTHGLDLIEVPEFAGNGWMAGRIHRWPILCRMHCPWELFCRINRVPANPMNRILGMLERNVIANYADGITAPSVAMKAEAERSWTLRRPIRIIPNFMDVPEIPAPLPPEDGPQRIVCVGRIERLKGQDMLARAFAMIAPRHPRAELVIVGPDSWGGNVPFTELLKQFIPDPAIRARVQMTGMATLQEIEKHLRSARIAVVASNGFESFSLSALEGMAAARPMVVTSTGALPELIEHEKTGLVVTAGSALEMALALDRYLSDRTFSEQCATATHAAARYKYDTRKVLPQMLDSYQEAADFYYGVRSVSPAEPFIFPQTPAASGVYSSQPAA